MNYASTLEQLEKQPRVWAVTGAAGFIGSHIVEKLLAHGQLVRGLDNFATGHQSNVEASRAALPADALHRYQFIEGDITSLEDCAQLIEGADYVLHQAALASVPRSIEDPVSTNRVNVEGFLNVIKTAAENKIARLVYASSSSVYGDDPTLPKQEGTLGALLSPYAASKRIDELYAEVFANTHQLSSVGLRYFNVFGPRQDPNGPYAAVLPKWLAALLAKKQTIVFGDGETSRDFCFVDNAVQANILAACSPKEGVSGALLNVAVGERTTLNQLHAQLIEELGVLGVELAFREPEYRDFREGDIKHSLANIDAARNLLGYEPSVTAAEGVGRTVRWYYEQYSAS